MGLIKNKSVRRKKASVDVILKDDEEIQNLTSRYESIDWPTIKNFLDFPISSKTLKGLSSMNIKIPTLIQKESIMHALRGYDILGAAVTGSGKTLAFLIPVLEILYRHKWSRMDGAGAIIISPTRELAYQIFECLKKVGAFHDFSAGLIIGGKNLKFERKRMDQCNIIICTPGRLLQHMDECHLFNATSVRILVLDEADRCLDMGFQKTINAIIENLSEERQTLLFSATQTKSLKDLARLNLKNPIYVAPFEQQAITPPRLQQSFVVINLEEKITILWSFLKNHLKQKSIVFLSSCKQVKYIYEIFCKLRPGISLLALYGTLHQDRRVAIYEDFMRKSHVVLFATDIASRGLDFPIVNWVIQLDCPEDVHQYIHRAGRSARNNAKGESLLVLLPSEKDAMLEELHKKRIEIKEVHIDPRKLFSPRAKIEGFLAQHKELKESARRALVSYIKSVCLMKNKNIFRVDELNITKYAQSLGLIVVPRVRFLERLKKLNPQEYNHNFNSTTPRKIEGAQLSKEQHPHMGENSKKEEDLIFKNISSCSESDDVDELLILKRRDHNIGTDDPVRTEKKEAKSDKTRLITKAALAKRVLKKKIQVNRKVDFNEDGNEILDYRKNLQSQFAKQYIENVSLSNGIDIDKAKQVLSEEDRFDKIRFNKIVKAKHRKMKKKFKESLRDEDECDESSNEIFSKLDSENKLKNKRKYESDSDEDMRGRLLNRLSQNKRKLIKELSHTESVDHAFKEMRKTTVDLTLQETELFAMKLLSK